MHNQFGHISTIPLIIGFLLGGLTFLGLKANVFETWQQTNMFLEPSQAILSEGETITLSVAVASEIAVNVFAGDLSFNPEVLNIEAIDYNVSIADLWAERPWFHNGEGTLNFAGGTTQPGGFVGQGDLLSITFKALRPGDGEIKITSARILQHDGLGTDTDVNISIDTIVNVAAPEIEEVLYTSGQRADFVVAKQDKLDLNEDGEITIRDVSIFMGYLTTQNNRADFNEDGKVSLADFSILMQSRQ